MNKHRRQKSREVSSRFLSPISTEPPPPQSPNISSEAENKKQHHHNRSGFIRGLWPSSTPHSSSKSQNENSPTTLADHLGNERRNDNNPIFLNKQRSCSEFSRFEKNKPKQSNSTENHKPLFGGSMRYTGKFRLPIKSSSSSTSSSSSNSDLLNDHNGVLPGRLSVDENALHQKSFSQRYDSFLDDSESSDLASPFVERNFPASYMAPTVSSRKNGMEVSSKYMNSSPKKFTLKNAMKRANSLTLTSKWVLSPGRSGSPLELTSSTSFSSSKPPTSPSRAKNFLNMGLDLIKGKKNGSSGCLSPLGPGMADRIHQLRLIHNRWVQWRYSNARAEVVNANIANQAQRNLVYAWDSIRKLQHSVAQKRLQLEKEKLEMKLNFILHSQIKLLEAWADMEWQHALALSMTKDGLHAVVCKVPLINGAKIEPQSVSIALRHASDLAASIKSMLSSFLPMADETVQTLSELVDVAIQEKSILEECLEHFRFISTLEIQERSLRCSIIEMKSLQQKQEHEISA